MLVHVRYEACLHRVVSNVTHALLELCLVAHPAIKPFRLPQPAGYSGERVDGAGAAALHATHNLAEVAGAILGNQHRVPMVRHDRKVRHIASPLAQGGQFRRYDLRHRTTSQHAGAVAGIEVFLHGKKIVALQRGELIGVGRNRAQ